MELNVFISMATVHMVTCVLLCTQLMASHVGGNAMQNDEINANGRNAPDDRDERFNRRYHSWDSYAPMDDEDVYSGSGSGSGSGDFQYTGPRNEKPPYRRAQNEDRNSNTKNDEDIYIEPQPVYTESPSLLATASSLTSSLVTIAMTTIACTVIWLNG